MANQRKSPDANQGFITSKEVKVHTNLDYSTLRATSLERILQLMLANTEAANRARRQALLKLLVREGVN